MSSEPAVSGSRTEGGVHFTVASVAGHDSPGKLDLREDLALVKASLLYADRVRLCSVGSSVLSSIAEVAEAPKKEQAKLVVCHLGDLEPSMGADEVRFFEAVVGMGSRREQRRVKGRSRREILAIVGEKGEKLKRDVVDQHKAAGIEGFREAVRAGVLDVHTFGQTSAEAMIEAHIRGGGNWLGVVDVADVFVEFYGQASAAVGDGKTYPLFDAPTARFVAAAEGLGFSEVSEAAAGRGRHAGLADDLLRRLPLFEKASVSEILDIRRDLRVPLLGFRQKVRDFAWEVRSAAWQEGFAEEADALFRERVEPEVERIEDAVRENSSYAELGRRVLRHGATGLAGGVVGGFLASASSLAESPSRRFWVAPAARWSGPSWTSTDASGSWRRTNSTSITRREKRWAEDARPDGVRSSRAGASTATKIRSDVENRGSNATKG